MRTYACTPAIPMSKVIGYELEILGSHGLQAHRYHALFAMIEAGKVSPEKLISRTITLEQSIERDDFHKSLRRINV
jgi:alcohol dehydrogenase